jgi:tungstate transport system permease protein
MSDFSSAFQIALQLIGGLDAELRTIILLSLRVSACAFVIGAPLGAALAVYRFPGRGLLVVLANTLLGLPPVVVGLAVYIFCCRGRARWAPLASCLRPRL